MKRTVLWTSGLLLWASLVGAQPLRDQVSTLLTSPPEPAIGQTTDPLAAGVSSDTLLRLFGVELSSAPVTSGTSGFVYELNPVLGVPQRASDGFGPFFTERTLRSGHGQFSLGVVMQGADYTTLGGQDLRRGDFPVTSARAPGSSTPVSVERLRLQVSTQTVTVRALYGVTDRLDVGAAIPYVQVRVEGTRLSTQNGVPVFELQRQGRASGIGDGSVTARLRVLGERATGLALGMDVRLPTGSAANLLGTGRLGARMQVIGSAERGRFGASGNAGVGVGGASDEVFANAALTVAATPRLTLVGEVLTRRLGDLHPVAQTYAPHSTLPLESMRWTADESTGVALGYAVVGAKWNVTGPFLVSANLLMRLTEAGLRARFTPTLAIDYDFAP